MAFLEFLATSAVTRIIAADLGLASTIGFRGWAAVSAIGTVDMGLGFFGFGIVRHVDSLVATESDR